MNHRAVFAVNHEHGLLHLDAFYFIGKHGKRVEAKLFEIVESLRVNNTWIAVGRQIETPPIDPQRLFELGEEDQSADRWLGGSHQKTVVATSVQTNDCRRGKTTEPFGFQPLPAKGSFQITPCLPFELNHNWSLTSR